MVCRRPRLVESYSVECPCGAALEVPARTVDATGLLVCESCWRTSRVIWRPSR